jgi:hypothetical protein
MAAAIVKACRRAWDAHYWVAHYWVVVLCCARDAELCRCTLRRCQHSCEQRLPCAYAPRRRLTAAPLPRRAMQMILGARQRPQGASRPSFKRSSEVASWRGRFGNYSQEIKHGSPEPAGLKLMLTVATEIATARVALSARRPRMLNSCFTGDDDFTGLGLQHFSQPDAIGVPRHVCEGVAFRTIIYEWRGGEASDSSLRHLPAIPLTLGPITISHNSQFTIASRVSLLCSCTASSPLSGSR